MNNFNIIQELENDIRKSFNGNLRKCKLLLFDFLRLKIESQNEYIGYLVEGASLTISEVGTLNKAGVFEEIKNVNCDDYFFKLLCDFHSDHLLKILLKGIIQKNNISFSEDMSNEEMFLLIKNHNQNLLKKHFRFRFFKLSDKYAPYEAELWEELKKDFGWTLNVKLVRSL